MSSPGNGSGNGLDPLIHEAARLQLVAVFKECEVAAYKKYLSEWKRVTSPKVKKAVGS